MLTIALELAGASSSVWTDAFASEEEALRRKNELETQRRALVGAVDLSIVCTEGTAMRVRCADSSCSCRRINKAMERGTAVVMRRSGPPRVVLCVASRASTSLGQSALPVASRPGARTVPHCPAPKRWHANDKVNGIRDYATLDRRKPSFGGYFRPRVISTYSEAKAGKCSRCEAKVFGPSPLTVNPRFEGEVPSLVSTHTIG